MAMPTYEELLAIIKMQQATIEELTEKLAKNRDLQTGHRHGIIEEK